MIFTMAKNTHGLFFKRFNSTIYVKPWIIIVHDYVILKVYQVFFNEKTMKTLVIVL